MLYFCKLAPEFQYFREQILNDTKSHKIDLEKIKEYLHLAANSALSEVFMFTLEDFVNAYPGNILPENLRSVLDRWSLKFGDLAAPKYEIESFFLENPVKLKPLIQWDKATYFFPGLEIFGSFCFDIIQEWIESIPVLKEKYDKQERRSKFLENQIVQEFQKHFPKTSVFHGNKGTKKTHGLDFESDVMVVDDEFMLVAEAKSYRITAKGLAGRLDRLKTKFEQLIVEPSEQARKIIKFLESHKGIIEFSSKSKRKPIIDTTNVKIINRLSVSLESLGELATNTQRLKMAGLIDKNIKTAPTVTLADLEVILDLLPGVCEKAHYFSRRSDLEDTVYFQADEMDLLFTYLQTGFNLTYSLKDETFNEDEIQLELRLNSRHLTPYLNREITKLDVSKPKRRLTKWWKQIIEQLEIERPDNWLEIGCLLLDMSFDEQICLSQNRSTLIRNIRHERNKNEIIDTFSIEVGYKTWGGTIALLIYQNSSPQNVRLAMSNLCLMNREYSPTKKVLVLAYDINERNKPFGKIWLHKI